MNTHRRLLVMAAGLSPLAPWSAAIAKPLRIEVWKSATCGCCKDWIAYLEKDGFQVISHDTGNAAVRARMGLPNRYGSCHTAAIDGYLVEGHVPAREIRRLLRERPAALGIAVPEMPIGSPGMDGPAYGNRREPYAVLLVARDGSATVYQQYD
jgi:hypothetical protein